MKSEVQSQPTAPINEAAGETPSLAVCIEKACKAYGGKPVLHGISLDIPEHQFTSLLGMSGSGKTTILKLISGLESIDTGTIHIDQHLVSGPGVHVKPEKRNIGMVFQEYTLFPHMSVRENILYGVKGSKQKTQKVLDEMVELIKIGDLLDKPPYALSGGQQQRVALARALAPKPRLLLLDEPFSNLDVKTRKQLSEEFFTLLKKERITAVLVTHDQNEAFIYSDKVAIIRDGRVEQTGMPEEIYHYPESMWVADFLGNANFIQLNTPKRNDFLQNITEVCAICGNSNKIMIRPEDITMTKGTGDFSHGTIEKIEFHGSFYLATVKLVDGESLKINLPKSHSHKVGDEVLISATGYHIF